MQDATMAVSRDTHIAPLIVFIDGLSGTGKTMLGPILSSYHRVEVQRIEYIYEYVSMLRHLGRIEEDAGQWMIRTYSDMACYNAMIGRDTNFRWKDLSGVLSNPGGWRYFRRLFQSEGDVVLDKIQATRPILQFVTHQAINPTVMEALGTRLRIIEMVRNPLYLISHWYSYMDRFGTNPRDFSMSINHEGSYLPWFAYGWEDEYKTYTKMDKVIHLLDKLWSMTEDNLAIQSSEAKARVLYMPFERFVVQPRPYLDKIGQLMGTTPNRMMRRTLKKERVPRELTVAGKDLPIYRRYSWTPPTESLTEDEELARRRDEVALEASGYAMDILDRMCYEYTTRFMDTDIETQLAPGIVNPDDK